MKVKYIPTTGQFAAQFNKLPNNGKIVNCEVCSVEDATRFLEWREKTEDWKRKMQMIREQVVNATTEDLKAAYAKEQQEIFNQYPGPMPIIETWQKVKMRVVDFKNDNTILEPAWQSEINKLVKLNY